MVLEAEGEPDWAAIFRFQKGMMDYLWSLGLKKDEEPWEQRSVKDAKWLRDVGLKSIRTSVERYFDECAVLVEVRGSRVSGRVLAALREIVGAKLRLSGANGTSGLAMICKVEVTGRPTRWPADTGDERAAVKVSYDY